MSKIKKITVSNLKAVSKLTADFNGCTAIITGGNNKGKSSFLKSLPERIRGNKPDLVLKHETNEGFSELELTTGEKFIWNFDRKKEKLTFITERNIKTSVTKEIGSHYFPQVFDVDEFLNSQPKKQKEILQKLTGIDFFEFEKKFKDAYEERAFRNKQLQLEQAKLEPYDNLLPLEPIDFVKEEKELSGISAHNQRYEYVKKATDEKKQSVKDLEQEVIELQAKIKSIQDKAAALAGEVTKGEGWLVEEKNKPKTNQAELAQNIADIKKKNEAILLNNLARKQESIVDHARQLARDADAAVKAMEQEKIDVIKNASMPDGFSFSDEGITYNGYAFNKDQLSSSGIYIAALKLAALGLGEVRTLHFDASYLDKNSLCEIEQWANDNDLQLLIERPDFEAGEIEYQIISPAPQEELVMA